MQYCHQCVLLSSCCFALTAFVFCFRLKILALAGPPFDGVLICKALYIFDMMATLGLAFGFDAHTFFFKLVVGYSGREELATIVDRTTRGIHIEPEKVMDGTEIIKWQKLIREVILAQHVQDYAVRLILATHPQGPFALPITNQFLRWGSSPRGAQTLALAAKVRALLEGRYNVSFEDVRRVYLPALRHRVILNFEAQAEGMEADQILLDIIEKLPEKADQAPLVAAVAR